MEHSASIALHITRYADRHGARPRHNRTVIAVDGKTLRGARRPDGGQVHLVAALDTSTASSWPR